MANDRTLQDMSSLSKVSDDDYSYEQSMSAQDEDKMIETLSQRNKQLDELHPYTQTLSLSDIESCVVLENAAFPPEERASREKVSPLHECRPLSTVSHCPRYVLFALSIDIARRPLTKYFANALVPRNEHRSTSRATHCFKTPTAHKQE